MKNTIAIVVSVFCFIAAALIVVKNVSRRPAGAEMLQTGEQVWMQCNAPDCEAVYQTDKRSYFMQVEGRRSADSRLENLSMAPPVTCQDCGKVMARRAVKCEKCTHLFPYGFRKGKQFDYADRCPMCGYSDLEQSRKVES